MPLSYVVFIGAVAMVLNLFAQSLFLWFGAWCSRIPGATYRRALGAAATVVLCNVLLSLGILLLVWRFRSLPLPVVLVHLGGLVLSWICIYRVLRAPKGRAVGATLIMFVLGTPFSYALALALRAAFLEGFVAPAGSMAPTILGAHVEWQCGNCGFGYAVGMSHRAGEGVHARIWLDDRADWTECPNCSQLESIALNTPIASGDRFLVDKTSRPNRWDLVTFRYPKEPTTSYVKRLVGIPGEILDIYDGDLFANGHRLAKPIEVARDMWIPVHDTNYPRATAVSAGPHWEGDGANSAWNWADGKWTFSDPSGKKQSESLVFAGELSDRLGYNCAYSQAELQAERPVPVHDVRVECCLEQFDGDGFLEFVWKRDVRQATARVSQSGDVEIVSSLVNAGTGVVEKTENRSRGAASAPLGGPTRLAFAFRDGVAYLTENGALVASLQVAPQDLSSARRERRSESPRCDVRIMAARCAATVGRICVSRDVYYRDSQEMGPSVPAEIIDHLALGPTQCCVLGDNSARSKDSRMFGPVYIEAVFGVARWIYWPPQRCHEFH